MTCDGLRELRRATGVAAIGVLALSSGVASGSGGDVHPTTMRVRVSDGFDSGEFLPAGTDEGDGVYHYAESNYPREGTQWRLDWDFNAVPSDPEEGAAWMTGNFSVRNNSEATLVYTIEIGMPLVVEAVPDSYYGSVALALSRGTCRAMADDAVWQCWTDDVMAGEIYPAPWSFSTNRTDSRSASIAGSHQGADETLGLRMSFSLTPGARMTVTSGFGVLGIIPAPPCPPDIDDNGVVDIADLFQVLSVWGTCDGCREDIDGDGNVDLQDVFSVLGAWGSCP